MQKMYVHDNTCEILINKIIKSEEMASSEAINIGFKRQENTSQLKQICIELVQDNNYHTNLKTKRHVQRMAEGVMAAEITQPANIGLQYIPRTSSSNVPRTSSKDPIPATSQSNF